MPHKTWTNHFYFDFIYYLGWKLNVELVAVLYRLWVALIEMTTQLEYYGFTTSKSSVIDTHNIKHKISGLRVHLLLHYAIVMDVEIFIDNSLAAMSAVV